MLKIYKTCEDMTYPFTTAVTVTTEYRIYESSGSTPANSSTPLHSCVVLAGDHLEHLQDILAQHVSIADRPNWNGQTITTAANAEKSFYIYWSTDGWSTWSGPHEFKLYWDYDYGETSYDTQMYVANYKRSKPIEMILDDRQRFMFTVYNSGNTIGTIYVHNENAQNIWTFNPASYGYVTYQLDLSANASMSLSQELYFNMYGVKEELVWKVKRTCNRYALYYVNRLGGWDTVLMNGKSVQTEDAQASQFKQWSIYGSTTFGRKDYRKQLTQSWELTKTNLTDAQAAAMNQIAFSNHIYLHDLETGLILPVNYVDNTFEWKKTRNNSNRLNQVTMNFRASQDKFILN